jgi:hypothetical protein
MRFAKWMVGFGLFGWVLWMPMTAEGACGCSGMKLNHSGTTGIMCSDNDLNFLKTECDKFSGASKGCTTTYAYECRLGVNSQKLGNVKPYQKTGFQPVATLTGSSIPSDCTMGQVLQENITSGGAPEPNPNIIPTSLSGVSSLAGHTVDIDNSSANRFPAVGATKASNPFFGGDNYASLTAADVLISVTPTTISWWDNPDQSKDSQSEVATWKFRFISFVNGSASQPSCSCAFTIDVDWNGTTPPTTTWAKDAGLSTNCTF